MLAEFAQTVEDVCLETVESGQMTKDLATLIGPEQPWLTTTEFIGALESRLKQRVKRPEAACAS